MADRNIWWVKFPLDFFQDWRIKTLLSDPSGYVFTIVYIKLLSLSAKDNGVIQYEGILDDLLSEIAAKVNEPRQNVIATMDKLQRLGLVEITDSGALIPQAVDMVGHETPAAARKRKERARKKQKALDDKKQQFLLNNGGTEGVTMSRHCHGEREIEKETELDQETEERETEASPPLSAPSIDEIRSFCESQGLKKVDPAFFHRYYDQKGWITRSGKLIDWKLKLLSWDRNEKGPGPAGGSPTGNAFNQFEQNDYNFDQLEEQMISN